MVQVDQLRHFALNRYTGDAPTITHFDAGGAVWSDGKRRSPEQAAQEFNAPNPKEVESACLCAEMPAAYYENRS